MSNSEDYESVSDNMLAPKIKKARLKAASVWEEYCHKRIPVVLNDIIQQLSIPTMGVNDIEVDGITRNDSNGCRILYKTNIPRVRQRFTVAHELGHAFLEHTSIFGDNEQFCNSSREKEANAFAGELLVPSADLKLFLSENKSLKDVMDRYDVSKETAMIAVSNNKLLKRITSSGLPIIEDKPLPQKLRHFLD